MPKKIIYTPDLIALSRKDLLDKLKTRINDKRYKHVLRVEETAIDMAKKWKQDPVKVSIAALMHDYCKDMDEAAMYQKAQAFLPNLDLSGQDGNIWHGPAAAQTAKEEFGVTDPSILNAIASHTIGNHEMDLIAQIVCVADYIEPGRDFPGVDKARKIADKDLTQALIYKLSHSIIKMLDSGKPLFEESVRIYNTWIQAGKK